MSPRIGSIIVAITSVAVRLSGDHGTADFIALTALGTLTIGLQQRATDLQVAAPAVRSCGAVSPEPTSDSVCRLTH